jgi:hypothetical protein
MTRNLFSSLHVANFLVNVLFGGVFVPTIHALPVWQGSASQEATISVTLSSVTVNISDPSDTFFAIDLNFTCADSLVLQTIDSFSFAIAYDPAILDFNNALLDSGQQDECGWSFYWLFVNNPDSLPPNVSVLRLVGENVSGGASEGLACLASGNPLITLEFTAPVKFSEYDESTTVDFCWLNCQDNAVYGRDSDAIPLKLMALQVFDAYGVDVTDVSDSLPSFCGPDSSCFDQFGDTSVVHTVCFCSGKIEFKSPTDVAITGSDERNLPSSPVLHQNYPNPFNPATTIEFYLPERTDWRLDIINLSGQLVREVSGRGGPGSVALNWDGRDVKNHSVSSGVYFYRLLTDQHRTSKKMLLLK